MIPLVRIPKFGAGEIGAGAVILPHSAFGVAAPSNLLVDGDMELADTSAWTPSPWVSLSKETTNPHGGLRVLRLTWVGASNPGCSQALPAGKTIRVTGWARGDGTPHGKPRVIVGAALWTGTISTSWQYFDITGVSTGTLQLVVAASALAYCEFDDVIAVEV